MLLSTVAGTGVEAQERSDRQERSDPKAFSFKEKLAANSWIRVQNLNGDIDVVPTDGNDVEVTAVKRWYRGDPKDVRFEVLRDGDNVTICALWENDRQSTYCDQDSYRNEGNNRNDVDVTFTVKLPRNIKVAVTTVNGDVDVNGVRNQVRAQGVNGSVRVVTASGPVSASSVNGSVDVEMETLTGTDEMAFSSVNGDVILRVPAEFGADLSMSTVNGNVRSDFPITLEGRIDPRKMRGTIGKGGRRLKVSTVNGNLEIKKR
jgi:DUF4097 and DUF4098 domain-containing protein YvlB